MRVLEIGPGYGRDTPEISRCCDELVVVEGKQVNCDKVAALNLPNVTLVHKNLESFDLASLGAFDVIVAKGIMYHLPEPWVQVAQFARMSSTVFGTTHYASKVTESRAGYAGEPFEEAGFGVHPLSGMSSSSFWLTPGEFARMFSNHGFSFKHYAAPQPHRSGGLAGHFLATLAGTRCRITPQLEQYLLSIL